VDGQASRWYVALESGPVFRQDGVVEFLAFRDGDWYRVTYRPAAGK
jgi:hypothetical protein